MLYRGSDFISSLFPFSKGLRLHNYKRVVASRKALHYRMIIGAKKVLYLYRRDVQCVNAMSSKSRYTKEETTMRLFTFKKRAYEIPSIHLALMAARKKEAK